MNQHDIGIVGIIGIILLAFASIGFCKGLIRTLLATLCLVIAVYVAIWGQEHAHELTGSLIKNPGPWLSWSIGLITGIIAFLICRYLLHFLVDPFNSSKTGRHIGFGFPAAVITFCMGAAFIWMLPIMIRILPDMMGFEIGASTVDHVSRMVIGGLIIFFLIVEPHGFARLWQIAKEKLRTWPFPYN